MQEARTKQGVPPQIESVHNTIKLFHERLAQWNQNVRRLVRNNEECILKITEVYNYSKYRNIIFREMLQNKASQEPWQKKYSFQSKIVSLC